MSRLMKIGRNDACPCGSGRKSKKCCHTAAVVAAEPLASTGTTATADATATDDGGAARPGKPWVPLQHQPENLRPSRFGRKKPW